MAGARGRLIPIGVWVATRCLLLLMVFRVIAVSPLDVTSDVTMIYHGWYDVLKTGSFPLNDVTWQYPPAAALAILSPGLLPFLDYTTAFFWLCCAADAVAFAMLLRAGRQGGRRRMLGTWVWIAGVPLLGPTAYARYDVMVTAVAIASLLALARRPRVSGALAAFGAMLKVWPALLLIGTPGGRSRRVWGTAIGTTAAIALLFGAAMPGAFSFLTFQGGRGTEVESVGSLVFHYARHHGWQGQVALNYGSVEFLGPYVDVVSRIALGLAAIALGWLVLWRLMARTFTAATPFDAAFTAVLLFTTTSRVISPQYMIWLVGLAAACMTLRASVMALPTALILLATGVTFYEFPAHFHDVVVSDHIGVALLVLRNGLLVVASLIACRRLWVSAVRTTPDRAPAQADGTEAGSEPESDRLLTW
ncbi:MAG: hypothetical protein QOF84_6029 [Streptomyces sp.]|nr:hypothetical protein [Streptomyces sp.]